MATTSNPQNSSVEVYNADSFTDELAARPVWRRFALLVWVGVVAASDFLIIQQGWHAGLNVPLWSLVLAAGAYILRQTTPPLHHVLLWLAAWLAVAVSASLEMSAGKVFVVLLLVVIAGMSLQCPRGSAADLMARGFTFCLSVLAAPFRGAQVLLATIPVQANFSKRCLQVISYVTPAAVLLVVFGFTLLGANAVLMRWSLILENYVLHELSIMLDAVPLGRVLLWALFLAPAAALTLPYLSPWLLDVLGRSAKRAPAPDDVALRVMQNRLALAAMTGLFFVSVSVEAGVHLAGASLLPADMTYANYVHRGIGALTLSVLLSAVVITGIFMQNEVVTRDRWVRRLGLSWIVLNGLYVFVAAQRLGLYVDAYGLTLARVHVAVVCVLAMLGFVHLGRFVCERIDLRRLFCLNIINVMIALSIVTILPTQTLVAHWNAGRAVAEPERTFGRDLYRQLDSAGYLLAVRVLEEALPHSAVWEEAASPTLSYAQTPGDGFDDYIAFHEHLYRERSTRWLTSQWLADQRLKRYIEALREVQRTRTVEPVQE